jgi:hypothetical protein
MRRLPCAQLCTHQVLRVAELEACRICSCGQGRINVCIWWYRDVWPVGSFAADQPCQQCWPSLQQQHPMGLQQRCMPGAHPIHLSGASSKQHVIHQSVGFNRPEADREIRSSAGGDSCVQSCCCCRSSPERLHDWRHLSSIESATKVASLFVWLKKLRRRSYCCTTKQLPVLLSFTGEFTQRHIISAGKEAHSMRVAGVLLDMLWLPMCMSYDRHCQCRTAAVLPGWSLTDKKPQGARNSLAMVTRHQVKRNTQLLQGLMYRLLGVGKRLCA